MPTALDELRAVPVAHQHQRNENFRFAGLAPPAIFDAARTICSASLFATLFNADKALYTYATHARRWQAIFLARLDVSDGAGSSHQQVCGIAHMSAGHVPRRREVASFSQQDVYVLTSCANVAAVKGMANTLARTLCRFVCLFVLKRSDLLSTVTETARAELPATTARISMVMTMMRELRQHGER